MIIVGNKEEMLSLVGRRAMDPGVKWQKCGLKERLQEPIVRSVE
jgi:hypothetical protein